MNEQEMRTAVNDLMNKIVNKEIDSMPAWKEFDKIKDVYGIKDGVYTNTVKKHPLFGKVVRIMYDDLDARLEQKNKGAGDV